MQQMEINAELTSPSWALARVIRRKAPWNRDNLRFPIKTFFDCVRDGTGVDIYHLDSGVDLAHPETAGRVTEVWSAYGGSLSDLHGHGTSSASIMCGTTLGIARGAQIHTFKVYNDGGGGYVSAFFDGMTQALNYYQSRAANGRPAIIMANFGVGSNMDALTAQCTDAGLLVVASAHNYRQRLGSTINMWPAQSPDALTVGGCSMADRPYMLGDELDPHGSPQVGSNYGPVVDILAPAQHVLVANRTGGNRLYSGNSFSTPLVAGIVACMLQGKARLTTRAQVLALKAKVIANATSGQFRPDFGMDPLPDRIAYLNPTLATESF